MSMIQVLKTVFNFSMTLFIALSRMQFNDSMDRN